jgi:hypothetical protein
MLIRDYILITPATIEPITLDEVKQKLRLVGNSDFDTELTRMIVVAREMCENITGRDLINKTYKGFLDYYCNIQVIDIFYIFVVKYLDINLHKICNLNLDISNKNLSIFYSVKIRDGKWKWKIETLFQYF